MIPNKQNILWVDCIGGLVVGTAVLVFFRQVALLGGLPSAIVIGMGVANLAYGSYSLFVTTRKRRAKVLVEYLSVANLSWLIVCVFIVTFNWERVTPLGILHVIGEGIYVAGLGAAEWIWKNELSD